jgi:hypothetical protein
MCFFSKPKLPAAPSPVNPMKRESAESMADRALLRRRSTQQGYSNWAFQTSPLGVTDFGKSAQPPALSAGTAQNLGV